MFAYFQSLWLAPCAFVSSSSWAFAGRAFSLSFIEQLADCSQVKTQLGHVGFRSAVGLWFMSVPEISRAPSRAKASRGSPTGGWMGCLASGIPAL
jgi:hypothetical protein